MLVLGLSLKAEIVCFGLESQVLGLASSGLRLDLASSDLGLDVTDLLTFDWILETVFSFANP
jgi:hypothetical protein